MDLLHPVRAEDSSNGKWYDSVDSIGADSDGVLFIYPYGTLMIGAGGAIGLIVSMGLPELVEKALGAPFLVALLISFVGVTGAFGIPLPWPFVPRWVVDIRKAKRARRHERRQARKMKKKE